MACAKRKLSNSCVVQSSWNVTYADVIIGAAETQSGIVNEPIRKRVSEISLVMTIS